MVSLYEHRSYKHQAYRQEIEHWGGYTIPPALEMLAYAVVDSKIGGFPHGLAGGRAIAALAFD